MKKGILTIILISFLIFATAAAVMASNIYVDGLINGNRETDLTLVDLYGVTGSVDNDFESFAYGVNLDCGKWRFNLEYAQDTTKVNMSGVKTTVDTATGNFKCGYALLNDEQSSLALTVGYHQLKYDSDATEFTGAIIGLNLMSNLSERARLEGFLGYSVSGAYKYQDTDTAAMVNKDADILLLQLKYSFYLNEKLGLGIGYKLTKYQYERTDSTYGEENIKDTFSGPTVGLTYRF